MLPHEALEVYWLADEYAAFCEHLLPRVMQVSRHDGDQLDRASGAIPTQITEAGSELSNGDKAKYFRYARREALETLAILRRQCRRGGITASELRIAEHYVDRLSAMLYKLIKRGSR